MNPNNKPKIFSDGFTGTLAIIGGIVGTIVFVVTVFGEWYADFDIEPVGLITGILTIALFFLPFALSFLGYFVYNKYRLTIYREINYGSE